jgi:hypothetical protein
VFGQQGQDKPGQQTQKPGQTRSEQALNKKTARFGGPYSFLCLARWPFIAVELSSI